MKRLAAHYIFQAPDALLKLHYVELTDDNCLVGIFPLEREIAQTSFYNGTLIIEGENPAQVYHLDRVGLTAAELSACDCRSDSHVQRLC
ncbi:hypothetical protein LJB84_02260 [Bacteroidales bacterium OttesenSCG-928-J19]|nr:hypothetical protein [Bacteroidales bacterium OttesenSCG-928-J19]